MTQVARIFEEEKQQALAQATQENSKQIVIKMIKKEYSTEEIISLVSNFSADEIETLRKEIIASEVS